MLAGFAEVEFTPKKDGYVTGGFSPIYVKGTDGGLFAHAAAFTSRGESVILVSLDILSFKAAYGNEIRRRISEATGVPADHILIAAIHNHTGPALDYQLWLSPPDPEISGNTADKAVEAAVTAWNTREEAALGTGKCYETRYSFNRDWVLSDGSIVMNPGRNQELVRQAGQVDQSVNVMRVDDAAGRPMAFIVNFACHPDCIALKTQYSADYPGYLNRALKAKYGENVKVLFFNGTAGDINCLDFENRTHEAYFGKDKNAPKVIGEALAADIIKLNLKIVADQTDPLIQSVSEMHKTVRRKKTPEMREWALEVKKKEAAGEKLSFLEIAFPTEYLEDDSDIPDTVDLEIHTIQLGPWAIVGLPGEIYTRIGLKIKAESPYPETVVFELSNGTHGYISPDFIQQSTTYEGKYSKYNAYTGLGTEDVLVTGAKKQLSALHEKNKEYIASL